MKKISGMNCTCPPTAIQKYVRHCAGESCAACWTSASVARVLALADRLLLPVLTYATRRCRRGGAAGACGSQVGEPLRRRGLPSADVLRALGPASHQCSCGPPSVDCRALDAPTPRRTRRTLTARARPRARLAKLPPLSPVAAAPGTGRLPSPTAAVPAAIGHVVSRRLACRSRTPGHRSLTVWCFRRPDRRFRRERRAPCL